MNRFLRAALAAGATAAMVLCASHRASADPPTRLEYARKCAEEMGNIPSFDCTTGALLPITKNGVPLTSAPVGEDCDKPVQLGLGPGSQCVPFSRFLRVDTGVPGIETAVVCRKYKEDDRGANDPLFTDIAVVQHNPATGNTCFFQSPIHQHLDGTSVPSPASDALEGEQYWEAARNVARCNACHSADPFVWSPYITQVANPGNWNPRGFYNSNYQMMFTQGTSSFDFGPDANLCASCHRIATHGCEWNNSGDGFVSPAETHVKRWMPPNFVGTEADRRALYDQSAQQIYDCCDQPTRAGCNPVSQLEQPDADHDFIVDANDNCPAQPNRSQANADADQHGDVCDNCPLQSNQSQVDHDKDGVGTSCDNCPYKSNDTQGDSDHDSSGDACDNCQFTANSDQVDTDFDGLGDACDPDDDNDLCEDDKDDKPSQASSQAGWRLSVNCASTSERVYSWDGKDEDGDQLRDCADEDDDGDGYLDAVDPCPRVFGTDTLLCQFAPVSCPMTRYLSVCQLGGCNELSIKILSVINPADAVERAFVIQGDTLFVLPSVRETVEELESSLLGSPADGQLLSFRAPERRRLEIWSRGAEAKLLAFVAEYAPDAVLRRTSTGRSALMLTVEEGATNITIERVDVPAGSDSR